MRRYLLLLGSAVGLGTSAAILSGYIWVGRGDPSTRVIRSFLAESDLGAFTSDWENWSGTWPAGYFLIQGAWIRLMGALGVGSVFHQTQGVLWLSTLAWVVVLVGAYGVVSRAVSAEWGWLTVAGLLALPLLTELSHNAYASIYFGALFVLTLRSLIEFEATARIRWLAVAGLLLLAASTLRTEAVVVSAALALVVMLRHGVLHAGGFFVLAASLTLVRIIVVMTVGQTTADFFQQVPQPLSRRLTDLATLMLYLVVPTAIVLEVLRRHFGSRIPGRGTFDGGLKGRLAEYAAAGGGSLLAFFLGAMLFLPMLGPDSRFLLIPSIASIILLGCLATTSADEAWRRMRPLLAPWVAISFVVQVFVLGVDYLADRPRPPQAVRDAAEWLRAREGPEILLAVDHLDWWQQTLLLYASRSSEELRRSYVHTSVPPLEDSQPRPESEADLAGAYLVQYHPDYIVWQGSRIDGHPEGGYVVSGPSFFDPWIEEDDGRWLVTPPGSVVVAAVATSVVENDWLRILEPSWVDPR